MATRHAATQTDTREMAPWNTPSDWRDVSTREPTRKNLFGSQRESKFCPGKRCCTWINNSLFPENTTSPDGLGDYCTTCNDRRKSRKKVALFGGRARSSQWFATEEFDARALKAATGGYKRDTDGSHDKFAMHKQQYLHEHGGEDAGCSNKDDTDIVIENRINSAARRAEERFGVKIKTDVVEITRHLFLKKLYRCNITGTLLTRECFADHHAVFLQVQDGNEGPTKLKIVCSECTRVGSADETAKQ